MLTKNSDDRPLLFRALVPALQAFYATAVQLVQGRVQGERHGSRVCFFGSG
jgi:hypothetical protein